MSEARPRLADRLNRSLPALDEIERNIYRTIAFAFPLLTMVIITGAVWAQYVWQKWWSWDPKETASLVTWLIYAAYLHGRRQRSWRGGQSAGFAVAGMAAVLFTYAGVNLLQSLHSYGLSTPSATGRILGGFEDVSSVEAALTTGMFLSLLVGFLCALVGVIYGGERPRRAALWIAIVALAANTTVLALRVADAGRLTFTSGYDFSLWFVWGITLSALVLARGRQVFALLAGLPLAMLVAMYGYLYFPHKGHVPLPPSLQNKLWLHVHVSLAIFAYGALALAAGWGVIYWVKQAAVRRAERAAARPEE